MLLGEGRGAGRAHGSEGKKARTVKTRDGLLSVGSFMFSLPLRVLSKLHFFSLFLSVWIRETRRGKERMAGARRCLSFTFLLPFLARVIKALRLTT